MRVIEIKKDSVACNDEEVTNFLDVLQGIAYACDSGEYAEGQRNQIAVDLTVSAYMLGLDPDDVLNDFMDEELITEADDDEYPTDRVSKVMEYYRRFDWEYMIDPDYYSHYERPKERRCPIVFTLVD